MQFRLRAKALPLVCLTLLFSSSAALAIREFNSEVHHSLI